jgi:hypothetical protein
MTLNKSTIAISVKISLLAFLVSTSGGQQQSTVKKVSVVTADQLVFTIWLDRYETDRQQSRTLKYKIENRSARAVYLVLSNTADIDRGEDSITIGTRVPYPEGHGRTDYSFTKIQEFGSYNGKLEIPWSMYPYSRDCEIKTVFVYTYSVEGLRVPPPSGDPLELLAPLSELAHVVTVGNLRMKINYTKGRTRQ